MCRNTNYKNICLSLAWVDTYGNEWIAVYWAKCVHMYVWLCWKNVYCNTVLILKPASERFAMGEALKIANHACNNKSEHLTHNRVLENWVNWKQKQQDSCRFRAPSRKFELNWLCDFNLLRLYYSLLFNERIAGFKCSIRGAKK